MKVFEIGSPQIGDVRMKRAIWNCRMVDVHTGETQDGITILWENGVIVEVGRKIDLTGAEVIDGSGYTVTPGLLNGFTQLGIEEYGMRWEGSDSYEASGTIQPDLSVIDGINPFDKGFKVAQAAGITTVHVSPGPQNVMSGQTAIIKTSGTIIEDMIVQSSHGLAVSIGEAPRHAYSRRFKEPMSRMGLTFRIRERLTKTLLNIDSIHEENILRRIVEKKATLYVQVHRVDDILTAIRLKEEFDLQMVLIHATEAHEITEVLEKHDIPVLAGPYFSSSQTSEKKKLHPSSAVKLHAAGIPIGLVTNIVRNLTVEGALVIREGLNPNDVLHALTLGAAEILGIADKVGSIEVGKHADLLLWEGEPLELTTPLHETIINGKTVFSREGAFQ